MIYFSADSRFAEAWSDDAITQHSIGIPVQVKLSDEFAGLQKILVFKSKTASVDLVYGGGQIILPHEMTDSLGPIQIGCYAALPDGTIIIPTVWALVGLVIKNAEPSGFDPLEPTPSWAAQTQAMATEALENSAVAKQAAITAQDSAAANAQAAFRSALVAEDAAQRAAYSADVDVKVNFYISDGDLYVEAVQ